MMLDRIIPVGSANCRIDYSDWNKLTYQLTGPDSLMRSNNLPKTKKDGTTQFTHWHEGEYINYRFRSKNSTIIKFC